MVLRNERVNNVGLAFKALSTKPLFKVQGKVTVAGFNGVRMQVVMEEDYPGQQFLAPSISDGTPQFD
ncbi:hypothetical protein Trydic_g23799 [Trypoxylus dichotomus]